MKGFFKAIGNAFLDGLALGMLLGCLTLIALMFFGCAAPAPGTDPVVLNVERLETDARSTFTFILKVDDQNRSYFVTNAPPFHDFCSWLREPTEYANTFNAAGMPSNVQMVPRDLAMLLSLDDVKLAYKAGKSTSNDVFTVMTTLSAVVAKGSALVAGLTNIVGH